MKTEKELKELIRNSKRPCGSCGEVDTMLFCCECLRELKEEEVNKRNTEVKQAIIKVIKKHSKVGWNAFSYDKIQKELMQKLGLGK